MKLEMRDLGGLTFTFEFAEPSTQIALRHDLVRVVDEATIPPAAPWTGRNVARSEW